MKNRTWDLQRHGILKISNRYLMESVVCGQCQHSKFQLPISKGTFRSESGRFNMGNSYVGYNSVRLSPCIYYVNQCTYTQLTFKLQPAIDYSKSSKPQTKHYFTTLFEDKYLHQLFLDLKKVMGHFLQKPLAMATLHQYDLFHFHHHRHSK